MKCEHCGAGLPPFSDIGESHCPECHAVHVREPNGCPVGNDDCEDGADCAGDCEPEQAEAEGVSIADVDALTREIARLRGELGAAARGMSDVLGLWPSGRGGRGFGRLVDVRNAAEKALKSGS